MIHKIEGEHVSPFSPNLAIIAGGPTNVYAPLENTDFEKWCLNDFYSIIPSEKVDVWFELHDTESLTGLRNRFDGTDYLKGMERIKSKTIFTHYNFPFDDLIGYFKMKYFHNSICYMLAYAIKLDRFEEIHFFGVDNIKPIEIVKCLEYWMGYAEARGIEVIIPRSSVLYRTPKLYAWGGQ
jgi:hypothetical protein